jgi:hypothetical protein
MGYYTKFRIAVDNAQGDIDYDMQVAHFDGDDEAYVTDFIGFNPFDDSCKWYDYDIDMRRLSKKHPFVIFTLDGEGEESGDIWRNYYYFGKCQSEKVKIEFAPFSMDKLR